ncbi:hexose transporter [Plectosphaerella cucumerina]|uniref:Hexose transporter n=1 Tax=Plectosphaerella cucumerina TaxID=40658 RepID=A0A8K0TQ31_9PEZI|nr:hexose transporter [Plectosphaerella cucumerina]
MLFGFDVSSMSAWIIADQYLEYFNHPSSALQGGITASMSGGSLVGAVAAGFIADPFGRKGALQIASIIWIIGAALQCSSQNVAHLIVGRVVSGFSIGITSSQCCVYLAELAPGRIRGRIVGIQQWAIEWGILIMYLISYACVKTIDSAASFRVAWGVQGIPGAILFASLLFFPESPRWLAGRERWEEVHEILAHLHGKGDFQDPVVLAELEEVKDAARIAHEASGVSFFGLFGPGIWKRTLVGCSVQVWQQLFGGNVQLYYLGYIFRMAGMEGEDALTSSIIQYVIFLVTTGAVLPFIDRLGRRKLLLGGAVIGSIIHFATAGVMAEYGYPVNGLPGMDNLTWSIEGAPSRAIIAMSFIFVGVYGSTWAPVGWIYCSEVFPLRFRAKGVGLAAASNWAFNLALAFFVPPAFENIQWRTYIVFGVFTVVMLPHIYFTYPETAGRTLEEIDMIFDNNIPAWRSSTVESHLHNRASALKTKQSEGPTATNEEYAKETV